MSEPQEQTAAPMLEVKNLTCGYGEMSVVRHLDLSVARGKTLALVGANGAGKTSTLMAIAGHTHRHEGSVTLSGQPIHNLAATERVAQGVAWVPEGRRLFPDLSVRENLIVGGYCQPLAAQTRNMERVIALFPRVGERLQQRAGSLSGGEQQMVAIGRALMAQPRLLLIDELSLGLMPIAITQIYAAIGELKREGLAILLVEQNTSNALKAADQLVVLESGECVWRGSAQEASQEANLIDTYLGLDREAS